MGDLAKYLGGIDLSSNYLTLIYPTPPYLLSSPSPKVQKKILPDVTIEWVGDLDNDMYFPTPYVIVEYAAQTKSKLPTIGDELTKVAITENVKQEFLYNDLGEDYLNKIDLYYGYDLTKLVADAKSKGYLDIVDDTTITLEEDNALLQKPDLFVN